jgi:hypothetical protein
MQKMITRVSSNPFIAAINNGVSETHMQALAYILSCVHVTGKSDDTVGEQFWMGVRTHQKITGMARPVSAYLDGKYFHPFLLDCGNYDVESLKHYAEKYIEKG